MRSCSTTLAIACGIALATGVPAAASDPELGPLISGGTGYVDGTFVWTDYAYDDRGPNDGDLFQGGDHDYPDEATPGNAADLIQIQIAVDPSGQVGVKAVLNSLVDAGVPLLGFGFDTDDDRSTGAHSLPGGHWQALDPLGLEVVAVLSADGGELLTFQEGSFVSSGSFSVDVDLDANSVAAPLPLAAPAAGRWGAVAVAGVRVAGSSWLDGAGPIFDLAFVVAEDPFTESAYAVVDAGHQAGGQAQGQGPDSREWQDHRQADVLAGLQASDKAIARVDFGRMHAGDTALPEADDPGFHTFLYHSRVNLGEGLSAEPRVYRGVYQPYLVRLPHSAPSSAPLIVFLHGGSGNHLQTANFFAPSDTAFISPGYFDPPGIVIFPLGRDTGWNFAPSEQDFLDALADARARLAIDPDRIVVSGISAGSVGSMRYGELYPDRWTGIYALAGGGGPGFLENFANLPLRMVNGLLDPLGGPGNITLTATQLDLLGFVDFKIWFANIRSHVPVPGLGDCVYRDLLSRDRVRDPARVVFKTDPRLYTSDPVLNIEIRPDSAYWVSEVLTRAEDEGIAIATPVGQTVDVIGDPTGTIDVVSLARADRSRIGETTTTACENATAGRDFCGPNPAMQTGDSWEETMRPLSIGPAQPVSNGMDVALRGLAAARLDLARMSLTPREALTIHAEGDGPMALVLAADWGAQVLVERDGLPFGTLAPNDEELALEDDMTGQHTYVLRADFDGDGVVDAEDNCPFVANPDQLDRGSIASAEPDGIGDACQCGDVTGNGIVNGNDSKAIKRHAFGLVNPTFLEPGNCDVTGNGLCNGQDANAVQRRALGSDTANFGQHCHNAIGEPVPPGF